MRRFLGRESFGTHLRDAAPLLVLMTVVGVVLQDYGLYGPLERLVIDTFAATEPSRPANRTFIFDIDDESYEKVFNRTSPLDQERLGQLILAAIRAGASVVAVDVATEPEKIRNRLGEALTRRVVWARAPEPCEQPPQLRPSVPTIRLPKGQPLRDDEGIALLPLDLDGTVRRYRPVFLVTEDDGSGKCSGATSAAPSFPRAAVLATRTVNPPDTHEALLLNWRGDRFNVPRIVAHQVLKDWEEKWWGTAQPVAGRIVLIGGTFKEARDFRRTPAGLMAGVEIMSHVIEVDIDGGGLAEFGFVRALLLDLVVSVALVWINWRYPAETRTGFALNAFVVLAVPLVAAWLLHRFALYWINMGPVLAGVWMSQWHDRAKVLAGRR